MGDRSKGGRSLGDRPMVEKIPRRSFLGLPPLLAFAIMGCGLLPRSAPKGPKGAPLTIYTFGDSILDCGRYNQFGITPGQLLVRNDDQLFPEFRGRDLASRGPARLEHRARDGATVKGLPAQIQELTVEHPAIALLTIGGNDLLAGLVTDRGPGLDAFARSLAGFLEALPIRPVLIGNVYDPTFGDDSRNFLGVEPGLARANHRRMNSVLADLAARYGELVDLHAHFLTGDATWFTQIIEPSLIGASEIRRCFLPRVVHYSLG